jgi:hypothetical protein
MSLSHTLKDLRLEPFSVRVAKFLLTAHPEWLPWVRPVRQEVQGLTVFTLEIRIPSENPAVSEPFIISTDLDRIMAVRWFSARPSGNSWDYDWVTYMPTGDERMLGEHQEDIGLESLLEFLDDFVAEKIVAYQSATCGGSDVPEELPNLRLREPDLVVRSWLGTFDSQ